MESEFSLVPVKLKLLIRHTRGDIKRQFDWKENGAGANNVKFLITETVFLINGMGWLKPLVNETIEKRMS